MPHKPQYDLNQIIGEIPDKYSRENIIFDTAVSDYGEYVRHTVYRDKDQPVYVRIDFYPTSGFFNTMYNLLGKDTSQTVELEGAETIQARLNRYPDHVGHEEAIYNMMARVVETEHGRNCRFHKSLNQRLFGMAMMRSDDI